MRLFIIRHGDPDYQNDTVTEKGKREVELLSQKLVKENISKIYCSPLGRARATAAPTCEKTGLEPIVLDWLQEFPATRVVTDYVKEGDVCPWNLAPTYWTRFPENFDPVNWRKSPMFDEWTLNWYDKVCQSFDDLLSDHGFVRNGMYYDIKEGYEDSTETIAFFCHLGLGNALLSHITGVPLPQWWHTIFLPTSSVSTVFMEKHRRDLPNTAIARVVAIGDTSHLYAGGEPISNSGLHNPMP